MASGDAEAPGAGRLDEKVAIVTGAGQGVGRGIALALASEGARVVIAERDEATGEAVAGEIRDGGGEALAVTCDVTDRASVDACVTRALEEWGRLDILVNNAQRAPLSPVSFMDHTDEIFALCLDTGLRGTFYFMQACHPHLKGGGKIINLGSAAGYEGLPGQAAYGAAKEAIRALSRTAAREWGADGINVNVICPFANSPGWQEFERQAPEFAKRAAEARPIARVGDCEADIGRAAVYLASADADYITGHTLPVDGGGAILR